MFLKIKGPISDVNTPPNIIIAPIISRNENIELNIKIDVMDATTGSNENIKAALIGVVNLW